jgi:hypothetical protein
VKAALPDPFLHTYAAACASSSKARYRHSRQEA